MSTFLFTSESVAIGHPDKIADHIADVILDACLKEDPQSKVACEVLLSTGLVVLAGEITTNANVDYQSLARETIHKIGYTESHLGFDYHSCSIITSINKQSPDIAQGVLEGSGAHKEMGAGDQGMMFGFACDETPELMPLPISLSHKLVRELYRVRATQSLSYLRPDAKTQVTVEYTEDFTPKRIHTIVISTQHDENVSQEIITEDMVDLARRIAPSELIDEKTAFFINPTGRFVLGGPAADSGLTGRKIIVDTYGGMSHHGGGSFSGKDPSKVDRSVAYAARYVAKNIVAAGLARRCEIQLAYAIGVAQPLSINVNCFGTATVSEDLLISIIPRVFDLTPKGVIIMLDLCRPIYAKTAWGGHFGREDKDFTWEKTDKAEEILEAVEKEKALHIL
jgi:S-adenosylmethionine synthetase